jgi:RHS repeat-associated protein
VGQLGYAFNATTLDVSPKAVGDLVTLVASLTGATVTSVSGGGVTTWHKDVAYLGPEMGNDNEIWWGVVTSTGASTISLNLSATPSGDELVAQEFTAGSGVTWSADGSGSTSSSTATVTYPSLTPSHAGELYFGYSEVAANTQPGSTPGFSYALTGVYGNLLAWDTDVGSTVSPTSTEAGSASDSVAALFSATTSPVVTTPLLWEGQYQDPTTGLYYMRARWYDPATGQFLSVDPALAETGQPYAYAGDDPVNEADPSGLATLPYYCSWWEIQCLITPFRFTSEAQYQQWIQTTFPGQWRPYYRVYLQNASYAIGYRVYDLYNSGTSTALELKVGYQTASSHILTQIGFDIAFLRANGKGFASAAGANTGIGGVIFSDMPGLAPDDAGVSGGLALALKYAVDATGAKYTVEINFPDNYRGRPRQASSPPRIPIPVPVPVPEEVPVFASQLSSFCPGLST